MSTAMELDRIAAAQEGLVFALVEAEPEADDGTLNVADVENAGPNEIILRGTFNTHTPAIIALHRADQRGAEQGIHRVKVDDGAIERVAQAIHAQYRLTDPDIHRSGWAEIDQWARDNWMDEARAALTALTAVKP